MKETHPQINEELRRFGQSLSLRKVFDDDEEYIVSRQVIFNIGHLGRDFTPATKEGQVINPVTEIIQAE